MSGDLKIMNMLCLHDWKLVNEIDADQFVVYEWKCTVCGMRKEVKKRVIG